MIPSPSSSKLLVAVALAAAAAGFAAGPGATAAAAAQGAKRTTQAPTSTKLTDSSAAGGGMAVDFGREDGAPADLSKDALAPEADGDEASPKASPKASLEASPEASSTTSKAAPDAAKASPEALTKPSPCTTGDATADLFVAEASSLYGVDPCFVIAVMTTESSCTRYAVSPKGACGYMQLMPDTARRFGVTDIFDARQNIHAGTRYLRFLLDRFGGNMELALAGYNAGETAVERYGNRIPPFLETQNYVRTISERYLSHRGGLATASSAAPKPPPKPEVVPVNDNMLVTFDKP